MGRGINAVKLIGVVSDHKAHTRKIGFQRFVITTTEHYLNGDGERMTSESWVRVSTPEGAPVVKNGDTVLVCGKVANRTFVPTEGTEVQLTEVNGDGPIAVVPATTTHLNEVHWTGRLVAAPEMRYTGSGVAITNVRSVAGDKFTDRSGTEVDTTCWVRLTVWRKLAELVNERLHKGASITCVGRISSRVFTNRDGAEQEATDITVLDVEQLPARATASAPAMDPADDEVF